MIVDLHHVSPIFEPLTIKFRVRSDTTIPDPRQFIENNGGWFLSITRDPGARTDFIVEAEFSDQHKAAAFLSLTAGPSFSSFDPLPIAVRLAKQSPDKARAALFVTFWGDPE